MKLLHATPLGRLIRQARWALAPMDRTPPQGRLSLQLPRSVMEAGVPSEWVVRIENHSRQAWRNFAVRRHWIALDGRPFGEAESTPLPHALLPGEWCDLRIPVAGPEAVGDFTLVWEVAANGLPLPVSSLSESAPVHVTFSRANDIDYHQVYRSADLDANAWWVVGAYHSEEQYKKSSLDRRGMLIDNGLSPDSRLLDVGCGTGQMAMALEDYLTDRGAYFGTDIGREAIDYCRRHFRRPNFHFAVGELTRLPFPSSAGPFDMAIFFSVFTHTHTDETALLLAETARLLDPRGAVIADIIASDLVARGAGHRGQMWVNRAHFDQIAEATGFRCEVLGRFPWGKHAERHMLKLTRR